MKPYKRFMLRMIEGCGGLSALRWRNRFVPQILMYHRIIDLPGVAGLPSKEFEKQITYIKHNFRVVPIEVLLSEVRNKSIKPHTLAITFDDGHQDFYETAWPILKKNAVPASLYITTGFVSEQLWLWPDLLKFVILNAVVKEIQIAPLGQISLAPTALSASWHILGDYCLSLSQSDRDQFIKNLAQLAVVEPPAKPVAPFTPVTWNQLREMSGEGLDIGSHTISHPILRNLTLSELEQELSGSADAIQQHLGRRPKGICYPNGRQIDVNNRVLEQAKLSGYEYGLLARNHPVRPDMPFLIGRTATHADFDYFKWLLSHNSLEEDSSYFN